MPRKPRGKKKDTSNKVNFSYHFRRGKYLSRLGTELPFYLAAVLEYLAAEILELSEKAIRQKDKPGRPVPKYIARSIRKDPETQKIFGDLVGKTLSLLSFGQSDNNGNTIQKGIGNFG